MERSAYIMYIDTPEKREFVNEFAKGIPRGSLDKYSKSFLHKNIIITTDGILTDVTCDFEHFKKINTTFNCVLCDLKDFKKYALMNELNQVTYNEGK